MDVVYNFLVMVSFNHIQYTLKTLIDCACALTAEACPLSNYGQLTKGGFPVLRLVVGLTVIHPSVKCGAMNKAVVFQPMYIFHMEPFSDNSEVTSKSKITQR
jgi:hypothetical protein